MHAEPVVAGEFEEHLFPACGGADELRPGEMADERARVCAAKDALARVEFNGGDPLVETAVPLAAVEFHFGKLRHRVVMWSEVETSLVSVHGDSSTSLGMTMRRSEWQIARATFRRDGESDHHRQRLRRIDGGDLCCAFKSLAARARR